MEKSGSRKRDFGPFFGGKSTKIRLLYLIEIGWVWWGGVGKELYGNMGGFGTSAENFRSLSCLEV